MGGAATDDRQLDVIDVILVNSHYDPTTPCYSYGARKGMAHKPALSNWKSLLMWFCNAFIIDMQES